MTFVVPDWVAVPIFDAGEDLGLLDTVDTFYEDPSVPAMAADVGQSLSFLEGAINTLERALVIAPGTLALMNQNIVSAAARLNSAISQFYVNFQRTKTATFHLVEQVGAAVQGTAETFASAAAQWWATAASQHADAAVAQETSWRAEQGQALSGEIHATAQTANAQAVWADTDARDYATGLAANLQSEIGAVAASVPAAKAWADTDARNYATGLAANLQSEVTGLAGQVAAVPALVEGQVANGVLEAERYADTAAAAAVPAAVAAAVTQLTPAVTRVAQEVDRCVTPNCQAINSHGNLFNSIGDLAAVAAILAMAAEAVTHPAQLVADWQDTIVPLFTDTAKTAAGWVGATF